MKLGITFYETFLGPAAEEIRILTDGTVKQLNKIDKKQDFVFATVQTTQGKLSQQQWTSLLLLITGMSLNYGFNTNDIISQDTSWEEIKRKG